MILLFQKTKAYCCLGEALAFFVGAALYHDGIAWPVALGVWVLAAVVVYIGVSAYAVHLHSRVLALLYLSLKPQEFIGAYEPLLQIPHVRKNVRFRMQSYLVSAYTAAGDFEKAMQVLDEMPVLQGRAEKACRCVIAKGRCRCWLYLQNPEKAKAQLTLAQKYEMENGQGAKELALLAAQIEIAEQGVTEQNVTGQGVTGQSAAVIREQAKAARLPLEKSELRLWLGRAYAAAGESELAAACWKEAATGDESLVFSKQARALLERC